MTNTAMIIGAGKIGRGFIGQLMYLNDWNIIYVDYSEKIVNSLINEESYTVHIMGNESKNTLIDDYTAINLKDGKKFIDAWNSSSLIFTSVGGKNLSSLAPKIANVFKNTQSTDPKNIITCENWKNPSDSLKSEILKLLTQDEKKRFENEVGVTESVVMRVAVTPPKNANRTKKMDAWGNDYWELPIDKVKFLGSQPKLKYIRFIDNFDNFLDRKMYTNNTSNATIAYIGYQKGYEYTANAANDSYISTILDKTYKEINEMIINEFSIKLKEQKTFAEKAREKYSDKNIIDPLNRHAADPIRKLGPDDRMIAPARLCIKHNIKPTGIIKTIVAALHYDYSEDPEAIRLKNIRKRKGIQFILTDICKLNKDELLYKLIMEEVEKKSEGV